MTQEYLTHPIIDNLDDHSSKLKEIKRVSDNLISKFHRDKQIGHENALTEKNIETMEYVLDKCLRKAADLSMSINEVESTLRDHYTTTFVNKPAMGRKLFLKHYFELHKPYDKVKNSIWKSIFIIKDYKEKNF